MEGLLQKKVNSSVKLIHLTHPHEQNKLELPPTVMALGFFDGIHLGHQCVIRTAKQIADEKGYKSAVMTFYPHPSVVLGKKKRMPSILHQCVIKKNSREFRNRYIICC